jgi:hypothetical protein
MLIKQLSVFLENRAGRVADLLSILENEQVNISAISMADTSEFGILRMVVSNYERAIKVLKENDFTVNLNDVISFYMPNKPGALVRAVKYLAEEDIGIEYIYAFSTGEKAMAVLRTDSPVRAIEVLQKHKMELIKADELYNI